MQEILKLKPVFQEKIWGGTRLREYFNYDITSEHTGECWGISAHPSGDCIIENGVFTNQHLSKVYEENRRLFRGSESPTFPLLVKILDTGTSLSVQVHPDEEYALLNEDEMGKSECWYIIDCSEGAEVVIGHHARTREELNRKIDEGNWDTLLRKIAVKPGDFFYLPAGTIHAVGKGIILLEIQQPSDMTYRLYDYERQDDEGNRRDLHTEKAKDVSTVQPVNLKTDLEVSRKDNLIITRYITSKFFTVEKWTVTGKALKSLDEFTLITIVEGEGKLNDMTVVKGDHMILTSLCREVRLEGEMEIIASWIDRIPCR